MPFGCGLQRDGRLELLQLLHGNRRVFLEETRGASAAVAAGLGDHGGVAESRRAAGSGSERDRQGVRELSEVAAGSGQTAEKPGVLHGCGAGGRGRTAKGGCGKHAENRASSDQRSFFARGAESVFCEECCAFETRGRKKV